MLLLCWKNKYDRSKLMNSWYDVQDLNFSLMVFQCLRLLQAYYCLNFRLCMIHFLGVFSHTSIIVLLSQFLRSSLHDTLLQALVSAPIPPGVSPLAFSKSSISCVFLLFSLLFSSLEQCTNEQCTNKLFPLFWANHMTSKSGGQAQL